MEPPEFSSDGKGNIKSRPMPYNFIFTILVVFLSHSFTLISGTKKQCYTPLPDKISPVMLTFAKTYRNTRTRANILFIYLHVCNCITCFGQELNTGPPVYSANQATIAIKKGRKVNETNLWIVGKKYKYHVPPKTFQIEAWDYTFVSEMTDDNQETNDYEY